MKKTAKSLMILLFFIANLFIFVVFCAKNTNCNDFSYAESLNSESVKFEFKINVSGRNFEFSSENIKENLPKSEQQKKLRENLSESVKTLQNLGLEKDEIAKYLCPESKYVLEKLKKITNKPEKNGSVMVEKNKCKLVISDGESGQFLNETHFYEKIFDALKNGKKIFKFNAKIQKNKQKNNLKREFQEKSSFSTNFSSSSEARKNNIKVASAMFDGLVLEEGEVLSFNKTTGERNELTGYKKAKIISGGTFLDGYGGGVCQVSTTLYNACLLAGLETIEVHSHSLPVSYVEPSFDAMVNVGSSDLVVRNNTGGKIIFTSSTENDICKFKIYGQKNKYKITRFSEKTKIISAEPEIVETNYKKYGDIDLDIGEEKRISYAKDGFCSKGYLNFYDTSGNLVETKCIRENKYNATKGILLRREE
jgi:vancomycin resistance protein YoaR